MFIPSERDKEFTLQAFLHPALQAADTVTTKMFLLNGFTEFMPQSRNIIEHDGMEALLAVKLAIGVLFVLTAGLVYYGGREKESLWALRGANTALALVCIYNLAYNIKF